MTIPDGLAPDKPAPDKPAPNEPAESWLLDRRVRHDQPQTGHRTGIEPVLLAAAIEARPGQRVLEGGTATGAALLCLAHRVPGITGLGLEQNPALAALATANARCNGFTNLIFRAADLTHDFTAEPFDHAFANPPWHDPAGTASPDPARNAARRSAPTLYAQWTISLAANLKPRGTLTLIVSAATLPQALAALTAASCGTETILPLWPRPALPAKLVLLRAVKQGRGPCTVLSGLTLHTPSGAYTPEATAILRNAAPLEWR